VLRGVDAEDDPRLLRMLHKFITERRCPVSTYSILSLVTTKDSVSDWSLTDRNMPRPLDRLCSSN
jgi:hypothetical protein